MAQLRFGVPMKLKNGAANFAARLLRMV